MIVLKDAPIKRSVESALYAGLFNAGQTCISTEEVYVEEYIVDDFISKLSIRIKDIKSGDGDNNDLGPIITPETKQKINEHISEVKDFTFNPLHNQSLIKSFNPNRCTSFF